MILAILYVKIVMFFGELAQLARASALHAEGRGFESHILHQSDIKLENSSKNRKRTFS